MNLSFEGIFKILFLLTTISYINAYTSLPLGSFTFWTFISIIMILLIFILKPKYFNQKDLPLIWPVRIYVIWNMISVIRGLFVAENYWEWKNLVSTALIMMIPLIVYLATNKYFVQQIIKFWLKYALILFFIFVPFITLTDFTGRYLVIIMFLLLVLPILPFQWKIIVLFFTFLVFNAGLDARSNIIRFSISLLFGSLYYFKLFLRDWMFKFIHAILMILPVLLLVLGLLNIFNIFKADQYIGGNYKISGIQNGRAHTQSLTTDTRTFLYLENIKSALKNHYILEGRTPANGYDSKTFGNYMRWVLKIHKKQRFSSEVSILNIFTWTGLIGVILYFLVFFRASYLAIYQSNNFFMKIIGLFIAFRWSFAFIEDFTKFELLYIFLWITIGMCYSSEFRKMSDKEFKEWVRGLLPKFTIVFLKSKV